MDRACRGLSEAIRLTQAAFRGGVGQAGILDVAAVGNTSDVYPWEPAPIADIDLCLFVRRRDRRLGEWLLRAGDSIGRQLEREGIDFLLKVIRGPYKPLARTLTRPVAIAHLAVFTEASYRRAPAVLRWSWRKYRCAVEPERLERLASDPPGRAELCALVRRKLRRIRSGTVRLTEWRLPAFDLVVHEFAAGHPAFVEYCLAAAALCARTHARALGRREADELPNRAFFAWYRELVLDSDALGRLMELKEETRQRGSGGFGPTVRALATTFLEDLSLGAGRRGSLGGSRG